MPQAGAKVRILILDDDAVFRLVLVKLFDKIPQAQVVAAVATVKAAQDRLAAGDIDLVTLDVVLSEGSGLSFVPWIAKNHPQVATALLTAGTDKRASQQIDAILLGVAKLILKPAGPDAPQVLHKALSELVEGLSVAAVNKLAPEPAYAAVFAAPREVIAVGSSTGGPPVVLQFLRDLPQKYNVPILITQHIAAEHIASFADMLRYPGGRDVRLAAHGEPVLPNTVYLACNNRHLKVTRALQQLVIRQDDSPEENFCRPAVDPMFRSVAEACGAACVGVVMTGMGVDGAQGALSLRAKGAPVAVQDAATSVVWGMPGAVVAAKAANAVVAGGELSTTVSRWTNGLHVFTEKKP